MLDELLDETAALDHSQTNFTLHLLHFVVDVEGLILCILFGFNASIASFLQILLNKVGYFLHRETF